MTNNQILTYINELKNINNQRLRKYIRNYRRYNGTPYVGLDNIKNPTPIGITQIDASIDDGTYSSSTLNIIQSCISTLTSKISESKVRPYFTPINGDFNTIKACLNTQKFFDEWFDRQNVNRKVSSAFRDCCIFDTGVIYIDTDNKEICRALPYQVYTRPSEKTYNKLTRVYYERRDYPVTLLKKGLLPKNSNYEYVTYGIYYDIANHIKAEYILETGKIIQEEFTPDVLPFVFLYYEDPIYGNSSLSICDILNNNQIEIDQIMARISEASQLTPANLICVPDGSDINSNIITNKVGQIMTYRPLNNQSGSPITVQTPSFIDNQYIVLLNDLIQKSYEMVGISQLSAMGSKPSGLDSGIALQSMENIESDRFNTQLNQVVRCYTNIAKRAIQLFDKNDDILPEDNNEFNIKWKDIVEQFNNFKVQFSAADSLSKDPSTKLQQLQALAQSGIIPQSHIARYMELPDIQSGYNLTTNAINAVSQFIEEWIDDKVTDLPDYIPYLLLKEEIINTQLSLKASGNDNISTIDKLDKLYKLVEDKEQQFSEIATTDEEGNNINVLEQEANSTNIDMPNHDSVAADAGGTEAWQIK